jgi:hypothetical protein
MPINLSNPVVVPETQFNEVWLSSLQISAPDPNGKVRITATIEEARTDEHGVKELRGPKGVHKLDMKDFFASASPIELQIMVNLITAIKNRANL